VRNGSERRRKAVFSVRNGSVTPGEENLAEQMQVMLLGRWFTKDTAMFDFEMVVKLEPWLRRYSGKKVPQNNIAISHSLLFRALSRETKMIPARLITKY
jgi:hypothetical protein